MTADISGGSGLSVLITLVFVATIFASILVWSSRSRRQDRSYDPRTGEWSYPRTVDPRVDADSSVSIVVSEAMPNGPAY
jgi:hypothetical protein